MSHGRGIRLFLVNGLPDGLLTARKWLVKDSQVSYGELQSSIVEAQSSAKE